MPLTVTLSGKDIIVPTQAVWNYLTGSSHATDIQRSPDGDISETHKGPLTVLRFEKFNHADLFASKSATRRLAKVVRDYSAQYGGDISQLAYNAEDE